MSVAGTRTVTAIAVVWTVGCFSFPVQSVFHFYMSRQAQSEASRDYGCLSHAVGASTVRQRGEVVGNDDDQTGRPGYQDAGEAGPRRGGPRDGDGGVIMGNVDGGLPQAQPGGGNWERER